MYKRRVIIAKEVLESILKLPEGFNIERISDIDWANDTFELLIKCPELEPYKVNEGEPIPVAFLKYGIEENTLGKEGYTIWLKSPKD